MPFMRVNAGLNANARSALYAASAEVNNPSQTKKCFFEGDIFDPTAAA